LVPAITIEELCKQNGIEKIDLLKLDIEGAEEEVLENGTFLARTEHLLLSCMVTMAFNPSSAISRLTGSQRKKGRPPDTYMVTARRPPQKTGGRLAAAG